MTCARVVACHRLRVCSPGVPSSGAVHGSVHALQDQGSRQGEAVCRRLGTLTTRRAGHSTTSRQIVAPIVRHADRVRGERPQYSAIRAATFWLVRQGSSRQIPMGDTTRIEKVTLAVSMGIAIRNISVR